MARAAVIIIEDRTVALIERHRGAEQYFLFPGGQVEANEQIETTATREAFEELGLHVRLERLGAVSEFREVKHYFFLARMTGGTFGTGTGQELSYKDDSPAGSYTPVWVALDQLRNLDVRPQVLAEALTSDPHLGTGGVRYIRE